MTSPVDHIVYVTKDLLAGVDQIEDLLSLQSVRGGKHPGMATYNAHIAIGPRCYIEIIGPDPEQPDSQGERPFGIGSIDKPRLMGWAARRSGLAEFARSAESNGVRLGEVMAMSRITPEGDTLD